MGLFNKASEKFCRQNWPSQSPDEISLPQSAALVENCFHLVEQLKWLQTDSWLCQWLLLCFPPSMQLPCFALSWFQNTDHSSSKWQNKKNEVDLE
jgi:hypothetical protein